ncbi:MAG TPA: transposase, partial [Candidatus Acidoferrum sp.]|nr:transposase [Candidatus Acidoferrum sp.]
MSTSPPTAVLADQLSLESLPNDLLALKGLIVELFQALIEQRQRAEQVQGRLDALLRRLYGRRSERFDPQQPLLFSEGDDVPSTSRSAGTAADTATADRQGSRRQRPGHGRQRLPEHLPREEVRHELTEAERRCPCCGEVRAILGEEVSEQLEYIPASVIVKRHVRLTYVCRACERRRQEEAVEPATGAPVDAELGQPALAEGTAKATSTRVIRSDPSSVEVAGASLMPPVARAAGVGDSVAAVAGVAATAGTSTETSPEAEEDQHGPQRVATGMVTGHQDSNGSRFLPVPLPGLSAVPNAAPGPALAGATVAEAAQRSEEDRNAPQRLAAAVELNHPDGHVSTPLRAPLSLDHGVTAPAQTTPVATVSVGDDGRSVVAPLAPTGMSEGLNDRRTARSTEGVRGGSTIITAPLPPQPWARCLAGAGLLAYLVVSKFIDHLPLYRLERILLRDGVWLRRSTLCDWLAGCARVLDPLYRLLWQRVFQSRYVRTDDTSVRVQGQTTLGRLWDYLSGGRQPYTVYDFTLDH